MNKKNKGQIILEMLPGSEIHNIYKDLTVKHVVQHMKIPFGLFAFISKY